ncbi:MAG TPA: hypothetical protein VF746_29970 [Longimicrobium sp.]|jgi:hypothetical protein
MRRKLSLELDGLRVDSFETSPRQEEARGTVRARQLDDVQPTPPEVYDAAAPCTCWESCACPSAAYYCATVRYTAISCDYTRNTSCYY